ncbi:MAG: PHB depolymerase family esterase [Deltaproteobacteria bacterium]
MRTWLPWILLLGACSTPALQPTTEGPPYDGGPEAIADAGHRDAGTFAEIDAGVVRDGGDTTARDAGPSPRDAGPSVRDAGAPLGGCGQPAPTDDAWTLEHDGRTREFFVHVPRGYDPNSPTPVVFDFHGRLFTATLQMGLTHMRRVADDEGFIVVHGEGIGRTWNGGVCCGEAMQEDVDDVGFVDAMIDALEANLCVDARRVYATGMSNGGFLSHRLACELSDRIAAIAPVAGVLGIVGCSPTRAVPVLHFHGTDDSIVGYDGIRGYLSVEDTIDGWVQRNGCSPTAAVTFQQDDVTCETWSGCDDGAEVQLCTIDGGGHTWPGGAPVPGLGHTSDTIDASETMWTFFERFTLP